MAQKIPASLITSLQNVKGFDEEAFLATHANGEQVTSVRLNSAKYSSANPKLDIASRVPWSTNGYYLNHRPSFTEDPLFHAGAYYVQEASSMFLEEVFRQTCDLSRSLKVLDLCAAPGGKSTLIQSVISADSLLVSNELIKTRVNILTENITKWGAANTVVTNNDPGDFQRLPAYFDVIVVDAPCSGSGLFRKDPDAIDEWSLHSVLLCSQRQQRILLDILPALKPGGILIYSTCSYSLEEDEAIGEWLIKNVDHQVSGIQLQLKHHWNIIETQTNAGTGFGYRFYPDKLKGEGFYIAAFRKNLESTVSKEIKQKNKPLLADKKETAIVSSMINSVEPFSFFKWKDEILMVPENLLQDVFALQAALYLKKAGIRTGTVIRNELIPHHELAMCNLLADDVPAVNAEIETALQYLRRADLKIDTAHKGWVLLKYQQLALGWMKVLPGRINNYYPREWRILNK